MGILDDDYGVSDDPYKPQKTDNLFNIDFNLDKYTKGLNDTLGATGGGEGGALPGIVPDIGKSIFKIDTNNFGQPQLEPIAGTSAAKAPVIEPIKPVKVQAPGYGQAKQESDPDTDALFKAFSKLVPPEMQDAEDTASLGLKIQKEATFNPGPVINALNQTTKPVLQESTDTANLARNIRQASSFDIDAIGKLFAADVEDTESTASLGNRIQKEATFDKAQLVNSLNPVAQHDLADSGDIGTLGKRVQDEVRVDDKALENIAGTINDSYHTDDATQTVKFDSDQFLGRAQALRDRQEFRQQAAGMLNSLFGGEYGMTSDKAQGMAGWNEGRFDASTINAYGDHERRYARESVETALSLGKDVTFDPEMAKKQAYPILDRFNSPQGYYTRSPHSGLYGADYSVLKDTARNHLLKGTALNYSHMEQAAQAMASLEKTPYGRAINNFMASVNIGSLTVGQEAVQTTAMMLSSMPPPEIAMLHYQQMYLANANDNVGYAQEVERMAHYGKNAGDWGYGMLDEHKGTMRGSRSDDYNGLQYFTTDPYNSAFLRPDRLTGDLFEKVVPAIVSLYLPGKGATLAELGKGATLLTQMTWIGKRAFNTAGSEKLIELQRNPHLVDNDPDYQKYIRDNPSAYLNPQKARDCYIQGQVWKSGGAGALFGMGTALGSAAFRHFTGGAEGQLLHWFQDFVLDAGLTMGREAVYSVDRSDIKVLEKEVDRKER